MQGSFLYWAARLNSLYSWTVSAITWSSFSFDRFKQIPFYTLHSQLYHLCIVDLDIRQPDVTWVDSQNIDSSKLAFVPLQPAIKNIIIDESSTVEVSPPKSNLSVCTICLSCSVLVFLCVCYACVYFACMSAILVSAILVTAISVSTMIVSAMLVSVFFLYLWFSHRIILWDPSRRIHPSVLMSVLMSVDVHKMPVLMSV